MTRTPPSERTAGRSHHVLLAVGLIVALVAIVAVLAYQSRNSSSSSTATPAKSPSATAASRHDSTPAPNSPSPNGRGGEVDGGSDEADGVVPDGVTVFDDTTPAVTHLDPDLLKALRRAATDASDDGVVFYVNSGWRSPDYQERLLREAVSRYGSEDEAARWVATPATSPHVSGDAVDIGHSDAADWLSEQGAAYGLCQIYENEPWHYELRSEAIGRGCPRMYADPTQDPRMQQ